MNTHESIITTLNLTKKYKELKAVDQLSLHVRQGEIYGFLGLNGAGKTTTIRMLLGMIRSSAGSATINGVKIRENSTEVWKKVGYMVEVPYSYPELTVYENLDIIYQLRELKDRRQLGDIIKNLSLEPYRDIKARNLSLGNAQRLGLAKALMHKPEILILDEPTNGLDPSGIVEIRELLIDLAKNHGATIFISSHILGEVSKFADRIGIIHKGQLLEELDEVELNKNLLKSLELRISDVAIGSKVLSELGFSPVHREDGILGLTEEKALLHPELIAKAIIEKNLSLYNLNLWEEDLETYFLRTINSKEEKH